MNSLLAQVIVWMVVFLAFFMALLEGVEFLKWLLGMVIMSAQWLIRAAWQCVVRFLIWLLSQLRMRCLKFVGSWLAWWPAKFQASMTYMKLVWLYLTKGRKDFDSFEDFKSDWNEFRTDQDYSQSEAKDFQEPTGSAYAQALEVLGLVDQPDFNLADLKNQLRKMRAIVHPDKGFPNRVFIQQLNEAFAIVKHERNWS